MASKKKITGLTVKIGADTSDFNKAMENSNKKSRSLKGELSEVEKMLKFDPSNVELLAQKQKILNEQVQESSKKLDLLKQAQDEVNEKYKKGEIGEETYRNFQRQVIRAEEELKKQKEALDKVKGAADDTDKALSNASGEAEKLGKTNLSEFKKEIDDVKQSASNLKDTIKDTAGEAAAIGGTVVAGATTAIVTANENRKATNDLQAMTGLSSADVKQYSSLIEEIYKNNFGEDQSEVANVIALVKQNLKDIDDSKLQEVTEDLFALSDTFGFDYTESLRAVKMLTDQFGISSEEAFNLVAQGAQNGLNKNGDMLDSINEYSVHYQQLGYTAEEFFNSLENGTAAGTFSIDKLGDAMKEFGIRSKDTATTTTEGFELIGLDADVMREKFAKGGDSAKEATGETLTALFNLDDQVKRNQAGVDLFGTMWEDLGIDGVKALMNVKGSADKTKNSMKDIKDVKYDDVISDFEGLGRTIQTDIVTPLGQKLYPTAKKIIGFATDNLDDLLVLVEGLGKQIAIVWGAKKAKEITSSLYEVINSYKSLTTATNLATDAQKGLNSAQALNVIGTITTLVLGLISAVQTYNELQWSNSEAGKFCEEIDKIKDNLEESTQKITDNLKDTLDEIDSLYADNTLIDNYQQKLDELLGKATLTPEEKSQLQTIVTYFSDNIDGFSDIWSQYVKISDDGKIELNGDLGEIRTEINKTIDDYQKLANSAALSEMQTENAKAKISATQTRAEVRKQMEEKMSAIDEAYAELHSTIRLRGYTTEDFYSAYGTVGGTINFSEETKMYDDIKKQIEAYNELKDSYNNSTAELNKLTMTSDDLSDVQKVLNGDYSDAAAVLMAYNAGMINTEQVQNSQWESIKKLEVAAKETGKNTVLGLIEGTKEYQGALVENSNGWASDVISEYDRVMEIHSPSEAMRRRGVFTVQGLILGMREKNGDVSKTGKSLAERAKNGTNSVSLFSTGLNFVQGFINGLLDGSVIKNVWDSAAAVGRNALNAVKKVLGINSPSKEAKRLGGFFAEGMSIGIDGKRYKVKRSADTVAQTMLDSFKFDDNGNILNFDNEKLSNLSNINQSENVTRVELSKVTDKLDKLITATENNASRKIYLDSGELVGSTTKKYDESLADLSVKKSGGGN